MAPCEKAGQESKFIRTFASLATVKFQDPSDRIRCYSVWRSSIGLGVGPKYHVDYSALIFQGSLFLSSVSSFFYFQKATIKSRGLAKLTSLRIVGHFSAFGAKTEQISYALDKSPAPDCNALGPFFLTGGLHVCQVMFHPLPVTAPDLIMARQPQQLLHFLPVTTGFSRRCPSTRLPDEKSNSYRESLKSRR